MLLEASRVSRKWRAGVLDNGLWKRKFNTEGWLLDAHEVQRFEDDCNDDCPKLVDTSLPWGLGKQETRMSKDYFQRRRDMMRRACQQVKNAPETSPFHPIMRWQTYRSPNPLLVVADEVGEVQDDHDMPDVEENGLHQEDPGMQEPSRSPDRKIESSQNEASRLETRAVSKIPLKEALIWGVLGKARLNYHHVFKQKRKLEHNWETGQYKSFQLPHKDYPEDAHTECVYTIQYSGKYLVSGSRDRTLRIWDLDTQRLCKEPLQGHTGSVLCLQFDDSADENIIVSGSSDESVILWEFSTGRMIKRLANAHRESVLNLKFDKRFLVTCSKDKTIKIWNRHELRVGDRDYPVKGVSGGGQCPVYIIDMNDISTALCEPHLFPGRPMLLEPYTHLMTLDLHGAAVNAIQIFRDELVSASGDRNIRIWNIHTGESSTKMEAHTKGIACVQYDGKRIVSGSSDRTIRIWDPISKTEVARLDGHSNLVRTIQAAFADYPGGRNNLEAEALEVERKFKEASMAGLIGPESGRKSRGTPGSRKPKDFKSIGAKIPPSGGGGKWGRIVSGSYDETIIIWKKTEDDEWVIGHRLRQEEALRAAGPPLIPRSDVQAQAQVQQAQATLNLANQLINNHQANQAQPPQPQAPPIGVQAIGVHGQLPAHQIAQNAMQSNPAASSIGPAAVPNPAADATQSHHLNPGMPQSQQQTLAQSQQNAPNAPPPPPPPPGTNQQQAGWPLPAQPIGVPPVPLNRPRPPRPLAGNHNNQTPPVGQPNARVFKLQFDARRIICCSQDPKIVGWDFANGDRGIMDCCRFFAAPQ